MKSTILSLSLCLGMGLPLAAAELPPPEIPFNCGVQMKPDTFNLKTLEEVYNLGFRIVRRGFYWHGDEKTRGVYSFPNDPQMKFCAERGITVIGVIFGCNKLYEDNGKGGIQTEEGRRRAEAFQKTKVWIARMRRMKIFGTLPDELERQAREKYGSRDYNALDDEMRKTFVKVISLDLTDALPDITVPTLLIWGDQDTETPLWMGRKMEELIPDAGLVVFEGGTHFAYLEQNARFNTITHHFFVEE